MNPAQWARVKALFAELLDRDPADWKQALAAESDARVVDEVQRLLLAHQDTDDFLADGPKVAATDTVLGAQLGPFRIQRLLGEGGSGRVYLAERVDLGGRVAIKLLRGRFIDPELGRRFRAEQGILARLEHPHIARLLQVGVADDGTPWLAMEYVEGKAYRDAIAELSIEQRLRMFIKLLDAVDYAHRQLVVHRDIKPGNIVVDARGEPRLLDFGIAKRLDQNAEQTQTEFAPRTPAYAAPEQVRGEPISVATDVYALGVLLYESLCGRKPWSMTGSALDQAILAGEPPLPSSQATGPLQRAIKGDLDAIVLQAMQRDPRRRYPSAAVMAQDLQRHLDRLPVSAQRQTLRYRGQRFLRRNYRWLALALMVVFALGFAVLRETRLRQQADLEAQKSAQVAEFMLHIFDAGDSLSAEFAISKDSTVLDLIARADAQLQQLGSAPLVQAELAHKIGQVYWGLSDYGAAERQFESALAIRREQLGAHDDTAESQLMLGRVYGRTGRYEQMLSAMQQSYRMRLAVLGPEAPNTLHSLHRIGTAHYFLNQLDQAEEHLQQVIVALRNQTSGNEALLANALTIQASVHADRAEFAQAIEMFEEVVELFRALYPPNHPFISEGLHNLSTCLFDIGRVDEAIAIHRQVIAISEAAFETDDSSKVIDYEWMARYQIAAGDLLEARVMAERAVGMASRLHQADPNPNLLDRARQIEVELLRAEGRPEQALSLQREVLSSRLARLPAQHRFVIESRSVLADLLRDRGELAQADATLEQAIQGWQQQPGGYVRQLVHALAQFSKDGRCAWLDRTWPTAMSVPMREALQGARGRCGGDFVAE